MKLQNFLKTIRLVDRCLLVLMALLLAQSAYNLFVHEANSQETDAIDIVVRTTSAAIFGYFLSSNFIKGDASEFSSEPQRTGFTGLDEIHRADPEKTSASAYHPSKEQVIIATIIGAFSLLLLILVRNFIQISPGMIATVSQLRDFVSGCVGFLLGSPDIKRSYRN